MNLPDSIFYFSYIPQHTQLFAFNFTNIFKSVSHAIFFLPPENFLIHFLTHIHFSFYLANYYFSCVDHNKLWKILQDVGIPDHLTCLLRNLYAGQEATVRTWHETMDWFQTEKGVQQGCILSPCLFNLYTEYIMQNAGWMKNKVEPRWPGKISVTLDMQMMPPLWQKVKRT